MKWLLEVIFYTTKTFGGRGESFYLETEKYKKPVWEFPCFPVHSEEWSDFEFGRGEWTWNKMEGDIWNNATEYFTATSSNSNSNWIFPQTNVFRSKSYIPPPKNISFPPRG